MATELFPLVAVEADMVEIVIALEHAVMLYHPVILLADIGAQNRGGELGMVFGGEQIADIVEQGADDHFFVLAVAHRSGRRLQRMVVAVDLIAHLVALKQLQIGEHIVRKAMIELLINLIEELVLLVGAVFHADKVDDFRFHVAVSSTSFRQSPQHSKDILAAGLGQC